MARPKSENPAALTLTVKITKGLDAQLRAFCADSGYERSEAARVLLARGLEPGSAEGGRQERRSRTGGSVPSGRSQSSPSARCQPSCPPGRMIGGVCAVCGHKAGK